MKKNMLHNENGSVLIVALIFLVLLTLMGVAATSTTNIELQIAHNEINAKNAFYNAEAAAMENIQELENAGDTIKIPGGKTWLHLESQLPEPANIINPDNWTDAVAATAKESNNSQKYITVFEGVAPGDSLVVSQSRVYRYRVIGRGGDSDAPASGSAIVEMGFKKAL